MFKLTYCWKCEEIKDNHKILTHKLPADVCDILGEYEKCQVCEACTELNQRYEKECRENEDQFRARKIITYLLTQFRSDETDEPTFTTREYKNIIKKSRHPLKKEMLTFLVKPTGRIFEYPAQFLNFLLRHYWHEMDFIKLSQIPTDKDREIVKTIFLELFEYLRCVKAKKYSITEKELHEYLEARMI